jgi:hypothetical protein
VRRVGVCGHHPERPSAVLLGVCASCVGASSSMPVLGTRHAAPSRHDGGETWAGVRQEGRGSSYRAHTTSRVRLPKDFPAPPSPRPGASQPILLGQEHCLHLAGEGRARLGCPVRTRGASPPQADVAPSTTTAVPPHHPPKREQRSPEIQQISYQHCWCPVALLEHAHGMERWRVPPLDTEARRLTCTSSCFGPAACVWNTSCT